MKTIKNQQFSPLLTDLYQITMAQGFYHKGKSDELGCFHIIFRDYPYNGGYAIACGFQQIAEYVQNFKFTREDIDYLAGITGNDGKPMFTSDFLHYLLKLKLDVDIWAANEGDVVFPHEPVLRITGPILQCQLLETQLLNCFNFQTLVATKAARVCGAAECPVMEFGLRRAQGFAGGIWASRAAVVGGCASTSNVEAGKAFDVPVSGTHAHSWVMSFEDELTAFRAYAEEFPNNCVLLVDTYDIEQGIKNAITVGLEMRQRGQKLSAIRIDSGDLSWLSKMARKMLDEAGLEDCGIVLSNDLDEYSIKSIRVEGGSFTSLGVGTKLATAYDQPALGGVYKLAATKEPSSKTWKNLMKISETSQKRTIPGVLGVRRYMDKNGKLAGDMIFDTNLDVNDREIIVDPMDEHRKKVLAGNDYVQLLHPLIKNGKLVRSAEELDVHHASKQCKASLKQLDDTQKRTLNPHTYPVGIEANLNDARDKMIDKLIGC